MSFLSDYLDFASKNEAPAMFHVWSAYTTMASAVTRRVWLPYGKRAMYPNIYVLLVGDAGNGKSIAMYFAKTLMLEVKPALPFSGELETPPGMWRFMAGDVNAKPPRPSPVSQIIVWPDGVRRDCHPMTILANEFIDFISIDDKGWINALNNIYDQDMYHYRTKGQGEDRLVGPCINMLGGLTTDIAHDMQKQKIISTGLARRTLFQFGQRRFDDPHPILNETPEMADSFKRCVAHLNALRHVAGAFSWSEETQEWWKDWYGKHNREVPKRPPQTRSWFASKPDQVLKLGMLSSLSESTSLVLEVGHLQAAVELLAILERDLYRIFGGVGRNELAGVATQMYEYISGLSEPVSKKQLRVRLFSLFDGKNVLKEFEEALQYLVDEKKVQTYSMTVGSIIDVVVATPPVLEAWAKRTSVVLPPLPVDVIQREIEKGSVVSADPSSVPAQAPLAGPTAVLPTFVLPTNGTGVVQPLRPLAD